MFDQFSLVSKRLTRSAYALIVASTLIILDICVTTSTTEIEHDVLTDKLLLIGHQLVQLSFLLPTGFGVVILIAVQIWDRDADRDALGPLFIRLAFVNLFIVAVSVIYSIIRSLEGTELGDIGNPAYIHWVAILLAAGAIGTLARTAWQLENLPSNCRAHD